MRAHTHMHMRTHSHTHTHSLFIKKNSDGTNENATWSGSHNYWSYQIETKSYGYCKYHTLTEIMFDSAHNN